MIGVIFEFANEPVEIRIDNCNVLFRTKETQMSFVPIEALNLDKRGVIKEHPDLKNNVEWRQEAIKRFKMKIKEYDTETGRMQYIIDDLKKFGYIPKYMQKQGFRRIKIG